MKYKIFVFMLLIFVIELSGVTSETASLRDFLYGEAAGCTYDNWVSHVSEGIARTGYNLYAPWEEQTEGFGDFRIPDEIELLQWSEVYTAFINEELETAEALIDSFLFPYEVVEFLDTDSGRNYLMLRENVDYSFTDTNGTPEPEDDELGAFGWSWGLYLYNPAATYPIIISAPHPNDDYITVPVAAECLEQWDAMFLFISGAGREVAWTEVGSYTNGKSISDPSRNSEHPIISACRLATDMIRENQVREFSVQVHSYDWNRHANLANCQVSVVHSNPNLPVRDLSELHLDMINQADLLMVPPETYGNNNACYLNDYYAVNYGLYPFYYVSEDTVLVVNNQIDLPGVGGDFLTFAIEDWNSYDVYDPFLHIEMDELPNQYPQLSSEHKEFYGYDDASGFWNTSERYTRTLGWYNRWIEDLWQVIPATFELDDGLVPVAVDSVWFSDIDENSLEVNWLPQPAYDFYSYRVYIDTITIDPDISPWFDRDDIDMLASPLQNYYTVTGLELNRLYYIQVASMDYNENLVFSEIYTTTTASAIVTGFAEFGGDAYVDLHWTATQQSGNQGFNVYRRIGSSTYQLIADWETHPELLSDGSNGQEFLFTDTEVTNNYFYRYQLSMNNLAGTEYMIDDDELANPRAIYALEISDSYGNTDDVRFSWNYYATDSFNEYYDLAISGYQGEELYAGIYHPAWDEIWTERDIRSYFNPLSAWKSWDVEIRSQLGEMELLNINISENYPANYRLYLLDITHDIIYDLQDAEPAQITLDANGSASLTLYAGDLNPEIEILPAGNRLYLAGQEIVINYETLFPQLIDFYSLILYTPEYAVTLLDSITSPLPAELMVTVPDSLTIYGAQPRIYYTAMSGELAIATAGYAVGIISEEYADNLSAGWHNFSSVWMDTIFTVEEMFGTDARLFTFTDSVYVPADTISFGTGYWLELPADVQFSAVGTYQLQDWQFALSQGWNLLPNPYPCPVSVEGLEFDFAMMQRNFRYMVESGFLSHNVYAYRDSNFVPIEIVNPGEAFYLYNLLDEILPITVMYSPGNTGIPLPEIGFNFLLGLEAAQAADRDKCWFGAANNSYDEFDSIYDFPALPAKPDNDGCRITLLAPEGEFPEEEFQTLFMGTFWNDPVKELNFKLYGQPLEMINLSFDEHELPVNYFAWIEMEDEIFDLDLVDEIVLDLPASGELTGTVFVRYPRIWEFGNIDKYDGVAAFDAANVLQYSVGINPVFAPLPWQEWRLITADVDGNDEVESYDAALILQYCIDIITIFPVESRDSFTPPEGFITLLSAGNSLEIWSGGNVFSLETSIPAQVTEFLPANSSFLWAGNQQQEYNLAIASAEEITNGSLIGTLRFTDAHGIIDQLNVKINGHTKSVAIETGEIPQVTELYPVYPNPFIYNRQLRTTMKLSFALAEAGKVKISVYNIRGQKVRELFNDICDQGVHEINWDISGRSGRPVASGVYFLQMSAPEYLERRKFLILK
ncbi:MAG: T9SS type A sorting domain-containing protein [Candidatus Cloacimonetes bacterium]|nr:T9SS type A sorting domain-containing protein [Candidatus Cloacimonadota bacterium]